MLTGIWKNFQDLEESVSLEELEAIVIAAHERENRLYKHMAAVNGIDVSENEDTRLDELKAKVAAQQSGQSQDAYELSEFLIDMEEEE